MRRLALLGCLPALAYLPLLAHAQDIAPVSNPGSASEVETITVSAVAPTPDGINRQALGGGLMVNEIAPRVKQTVTRDYIAKQGPTTNPEHLLELQPGANVTMGDPFGLSVGHMSVRGLDIAEIGWLFEGMPFNNGAVYPNEILDTPNLSSITLTPGSVDFDVPTFGAAGGLVELHFRDPHQDPGAYVNIAYGSDRFKNAFARVDSGEIDNTGVRGFISVSKTESDAWHGPGDNQREHIDFKLIKEFDNGSESAFSVAWNHQLFMLDRWPTLAQWGQYGLNWTYDRTFVPGDTNFWALHQSAFDNVAVSAPSRIKVIDDTDVAVIPYFFHGGGIGPGSGIYTETGTYSGPNLVSFLPIPLANNTGTNANNATLYAPTIYDQFRTGVNAAVNYHLNGHTLTAGWWGEWDDATTRGVLEPISSTGFPVNVWANSGLITLSNGQAYQSSFSRTIAQVNGVYVGDRASLMDNRLEIDGGFKEVFIGQQGYNTIPGETYNHNTSFAIPLPTLAARFRLDDVNMIYANAGTNFLTPQSSQLFDVYSALTGKQTQQNGTKQKAEYSIVEELGYRYQGNLFSGSVSVFNYDFSNRQVSTSIVQNGTSVTAYINAGGQNSRGVDFEVGLRPWHDLRPFISGEYLDATVESNIPSGTGDYIPSIGKTAVRSPHYMGSIGLDYDTGSFFANTDFHAVSSQYSTFMNDQKIPAYATVNATVGYRLPSSDYFKAPQIQLNLVNIADERYLGGVYTVQNNAKATKGVYGSTIAASGQPTYLAGAGFAAIVSLSSSF